MDPFAAVGLAAAVIQFVDFGSRLTKKGSEIYSSSSGKTDTNNVFDVVTRDLEKFCVQLCQPILATKSGAEQEIAALARECAKEAEKLKGTLYKLGGDEIKKGKRAASRQALKSLWKQKDIEEIHQRLANLREEIILRVVAFTSDQNSSMTTLLEHLVTANARTSTEHSNELNDIKVAISQIRDLIQGQSGQFQQHGFLNDVAERLVSLAEYGDKAKDAVLRSLQFGSMLARESAVSKAHTETFAWLFGDGVNFHDWLRYSGGVFWVSGKPGSGKSTLMKFAAGNPKTQDLLRSWACQQHLITASFYFWNAGTPMQKTLQGLLQSLLYQIMGQCRLLIPIIIAPKRWGNAIKAGVEEPWTWDEAAATFDRFIRQSTVACNTCLFIDGLDEFDGDHSQMVELLSKTSDHTSTKLCVASRPWNVFADAYGQNPGRMLRVQDLTRGDIRKYTQDNLETQVRLSQLQQHDDQYSCLVEEIVEKSDGVFLWVYLVVRSLKEGLTNADTVSTLQKRLRKLPTDLEQYFAHILGTVDEIYWEDTTKLFQMAICTRPHTLFIGVLVVLDEDAGEDSLNADTQQATADDYECRLPIWEKRLNARCKGLLEVVQTNKKDTTNQDCHCVAFLHRTVRDFLQVRKVEALLSSRLKTPFDVNLALCRGYLLHLKQFTEVFYSATDDPASRFSVTSVVLRELVHHAHRMETIAGIVPFRLLDEALPSIESTEGFLEYRATFYHYIIMEGFSTYLEYRLSFIDPAIHISAIYRWTPLEIALVGGIAARKLSVTMVRILLNYHAARHESISDKTWTKFLQCGELHVDAFKSFEELSEDYLQICCILLEAGAKRHPWILERVEKLLPMDKVRSLERFIKELDKSRSHSFLDTGVFNDSGLTRVRAATRMITGKRTVLTDESTPAAEDRTGPAIKKVFGRRVSVKSRLHSWLRGRR
ncbi:hypothetical protein F4780DRAFT_538961 [Xylariomycetidae sp. FL0641]|nr:hypothetical protein F4780DRAFT_538961 [Xylariomycetidae sp. FL0641]